MSPVILTGLLGMLRATTLGIRAPSQRAGFYAGAWETVGSKNGLRTISSKTKIV